jgi:erythritol kinase
MIAAVQQGIFADMEAAAEAWVAPLLNAPEGPDAALVPVYEALFGAYIETRHALPPVWEAQARMREALA